MPKTWSQLSLAQKIFTVATTALTLAGVEFGFFWHWGSSALVNKIVSLAFNLVVLPGVVYLATRKNQA